MIAKTMRPLLAIMLMLGIATGAQAQSATETAADLNKEWNRLFNNGQAAELAALYAEDALMSPGKGKVIKGREAIQAHFQGYFDAGLGDHRLEILKAGGSGDWLYEVTEWRATGAPQNAVIPFYKGIATIIFEKNDAGEWRIQAHTWNQEPDSKS